MCRCGHHPGAFSASPSLASMTTHELMNQLEKWGYKSCEIRDDGIGRINVITEQKLTYTEQQTIESLMPPGIIVTFTTRDKNKMPVPKILEKWYRDTKRYVK